MFSPTFTAICRRGVLGEQNMTCHTEEEKKDRDASRLCLLPFSIAGLSAFHVECATTYLILAEV